MRIIGIHKLPWNEEQVLANLRSYEPEFHDQVRELWQNAWLFVIEADGAVDFGKIAMQTHPNQSKDNQQAAWLEEEIGQGVWGFFLHYWTPSCTVRYRDRELTQPLPTELPKELAASVEYYAPE